MESAKHSRNHFRNTVRKDAKDSSEVLPKCIAFYNGIPMDSLMIHNSSAIHPGNKFLNTIFSAIIYSKHLYLQSAIIIL